MIPGQADRIPGKILHSTLRYTGRFEKGAYGNIIQLPGTVIAVKIPARIPDGRANHPDAVDCFNALQAERAVYDDLAARTSLEQQGRRRRQHPNIVQYFLSTDITIFMRLEPDSLGKRLRRSREQQHQQQQQQSPSSFPNLLSNIKPNPIPETLQLRWVKEIASAASWLETLDYFHGDLRPDNVLLDADDHVKVCDFGRTLKRGSRVRAVTPPFYRPLGPPDGHTNVNINVNNGDALLETKEGPHCRLAGPANEQFAIGSCIFTIRSGAGEVPYGYWAQSSHPMVRGKMCRAILRGEFPRTDDDLVLGDVAQRCWRAGFASMRDVEIAVDAALSGALGGSRERVEALVAGARVMGDREYDECVGTCVAFLMREECDVRQLNAVRCRFPDYPKTSGNV